MSKSFRRYKKNKKNQQRRKKTRKNYLKGGNGEKVVCSMCEKKVDINNSLIPRKCLMKYGVKSAHRICAECWWDPKSGFALETTPHACPGCVKGLPLTEEPINFFDLTKD